MHFNLDFDAGDVIKCALVPDSFSAIPEIRVLQSGEGILTLAANEIRESLVTAGRHETGAIGFHIDSSMIPGLADLQEIELVEAETGLLVYRRPRPTDRHLKILRLETHLLPLRRFDDSLDPHFQYFQKSVESFGRETVHQFFLLNHVNSVYVSGRIFYKIYAQYIEPEFSTIMLFQDPYDELAERLLVLRKASEAGVDLLGMRDRLGLRDAAQFATELDMTDEKALRKSFRRIAPEVAASLANPVTRQLTSSKPDEMPNRAAIAGALHLLSTFAVVGLRSESDRFVAAVAELAEVDGAAMPNVPQFSSVKHLAALLKETKSVEPFLEMDLELYSYVAEASKLET